MPNIQRTTFGNNDPVERLFKVIATGESGVAVSKNGIPSAMGRFVMVGMQRNVDVIDLCMDETGEIRTFRSDRLEEIKI